MGTSTKASVTPTAIASMLVATLVSSIDSRPAGNRRPVRRALPSAPSCTPVSYGASD